MLKNAERPDKGLPGSVWGNQGSLRGIVLQFQHIRFIGIKKPGGKDGRCQAVG